MRTVCTRIQLISKDFEKKSAFALVGNSGMSIGNAKTRFKLQGLLADNKVYTIWSKYLWQGVYFVCTPTKFGLSYLSWLLSSPLRLCYWSEIPNTPFCYVLFTSIPPIVFNLNFFGISNWISTPGYYVVGINVLDTLLIVKYLTSSCQVYQTSYDNWGANTQWYAPVNIYLGDWVIEFNLTCKWKPIPLFTLLAA